MYFLTYQIQTKEVISSTSTTKKQLKRYIIMQIKNEFNIGEIVFLITDENQLERIVTGLTIRKNSIIYYLSCGTTETSHYSFEIATNKNFKL